jgi:hypothetical protein
VSSQWTNSPPFKTRSHPPSHRQKDSKSTWLGSDLLSLKTAEVPSNAPFPVLKSLELSLEVPNPIPQLYLGAISVPSFLTFHWSGYPIRLSFFLYYIEDSKRGIYIPANMVKKNITIAIIIIILFLILAVAGFGIYAMQNHVSIFSRKRAVDEESGEEG